MRRRTIGTVAAVGLLLAVAAPAHAQPTATTQMTILDASKGACANALAPWTVHPRITITNDSTGTDTVSDAFYTGKYVVGGGGQQATSDAQATDDGGLKAGATLAAGASATYLPTVVINIPCDASSANLIVNYDLVNGHKTFSADAAFLSAGTSVPTGAVGALGVIAIVGVVAVTRRRKSVPTKARVDA